MKGMTKARTGALEFLASEFEGSAPLHAFLDAGNSRQLMTAMLKDELIEWTSTYTISTCATVEEFMHSQLTTSYVWITPAGRLALSSNTRSGE